MVASTAAAQGSGQAHNITRCLESRVSCHGFCVFEKLYISLKPKPSNPEHCAGRCRGCFTESQMLFRHLVSSLITVALLGMAYCSVAVGHAVA